jgi:hypothetical protein
MPAADVRAAVIGGLIYVPGGQLTGGQPTNQLNIFSPRENQWRQGASLPVPLSRYALAAVEGRLYLLGGWDGKHFVDTVYEYTPEQDQWSVCQPMPQPRGFASAAVVSESIVVVGGRNQAGPLSSSERLAPEGDCANSVWQTISSLPNGYALFDAASVGDILYLVGKQQDKLQLLALTPGSAEWRTAPLQADWIDAETRLVGVGDKLHMLGSQQTNPTSNHLAYQAYYTTLLPLLIK